MDREGEWLTARFFTGLPASDLYSSYLEVP